MVTARTGARVSTGMLLFFGCLVAFIASPVRDTSDSGFTLHTAISLARGHWGDLAPVDAAAAKYPTMVQMPDGRAVTVFPVGPSILLTPIAWIADRLAPAATEWFLRTNSFFVQKVLASIIAAATIAVFYRALLFRFDRRVALTLALMLAFATPIWSTTSRGLWSHGPLMLFVCIGLFFTLARRHAANAAAAGAAMMAAYTMRPTAAIAVVAIGGLFAWRGLRPLAWYALGCAIMFVAWAAMQTAIYGQVYPAYFAPTRLTGSTTIGEALLGNLVSPARGLFLFSPVLLFAIPGILLALRSRDGRPMGLAILVAGAGHWVAVSLFPHWWGGYSFGPRLMSDVLPFLVMAVGYWLAPALVAGTGWQSRMRRIVFPLLFGVSVAVHAQGAILFQSRKWNDVPPVDSNPQRVWDWRDPQVLVVLDWYRRRGERM
jgi:hypothetical protein